MPAFGAVILALALTLAVTPAVAGFAEAVAAFEAGDVDTARREWQALAEAGDAAAQYNLATLYKRGLGVAADPVRAARWYHAAARQGHIGAATTLGYLYAVGEGVARDPAAAAHWFRQAAGRGYGPAQYNLAALYHKGLGVVRDDVQALMWFTMAAENGVGEAVTARDRLAATLGPAAVAEARTLAATLFPPAEGAPPAEQAPPAEAAPAEAAASPPPAEGTPPAEGASPAKEAPPVEAAASPLPAEGAPPAEATAPTSPVPPTAEATKAATAVAHLASYRSAAAAERGWATLLAEHGDLLRGLGHLVRQVDLGKKGVYWRLFAGPFADPRMAADLCAAFKRRGAYCTTTP